MRTKLNAIFYNKRKYNDLFKPEEELPVSGNKIKRRRTNESA